MEGMSVHCYTKTHPRAFTLIEVVVSLFIVSVTIALSAAILHSVTLSHHSEFEGNALSIASTQLENARGLGYSALTVGTTTFSDTLLSALPSGYGQLVVTDYNVKTKEVKVTVSWRDQGSSSTSSTTLTTLVTSIGGLP